IHETTRELFTILDVPYIEAPAEGEAQAAYMARVDSQIDYAGTEDYDALLLGAPKTLRKLTSKGHPEIMDFEATLKEHDISWEQLVDVGILCGTDYNDGLEGFGPKTALKEIKEHGDLWGVLDANDAYIEHADEIRRLFLDPTVTDDYEVQYGLDPDIDSAKEYVIKEWEIDADEVERG
ncbi:MAG: flap structure-specific endonuclease, partial [Halobacteriaceae archaeon]